MKFTMGSTSEISSISEMGEMELFKMGSTSEIGSRSEMGSTSEIGSGSARRRRKFKKSVPHAAEPIILGLIKKLESWMADNNRILEKPSVATMKEIFDGLRMTASFLRGKKFGEGSRLNYLMGDVVNIVEDINELDTISFNLEKDIQFTRDWMRDTLKSMINLGDKPLFITTENINGEGYEEVVGLEKDVQVLLGRAILNEQQQRLSILFVWGMAGIGKTVLARQVYNHMAVVDRFKCRAWVCLSRDSTNKEVLIKIMQQVVGSEELERDSLLEKMERADNKSLQQMLRQQLQGRPYFIVVDNLLKGMRYLKSILKCLPLEDTGSRLLLTSRSQSYADIFTIDGIVKPVYFCHTMKALDSDKSWQLFLKTINKFSSDEEQYKFPKHLEKKGKEMMTKVCGGLPVAIIDVGRQKAKQRLEKGIEWEELLEINSIDLAASLELLESRYRELDTELQVCFLYVGFFKENTIIRVKKLEHIWEVAGGFGKDDYIPIIDKLAFEFFVEVVDGNFWRLKNCCVNPLLHRLSIKLAEEEIGFEILRNLNGDSINGANSWTIPRRHRVIHCGRDKFNHDSTINQDKHLVSLIFHGGGSCLDDIDWKRFELLIILDLEDFGLKILPETIGTTLLELKYLGLRNNYAQEIPRSLVCLKKLEILDISHNFMVEVPDIIWEMSSLHHLHMCDAICPKPLKIDTLEYLETLAYVPVYDFLGFEKMPFLRRVGIEEVDENSDLSKLFASLAMLDYIFHLTLRGFRFRSMPCLDEVGILYCLRTLKLDGLLVGLPSADSFPPFFGELTLVNSRLDEDPMPILERIPQLAMLKMWNAYTGRQMVISQNGFPSLELLHIKELWNLRNIEVAQVGDGEKVAAMEKLIQLEIDNCPYLDTLPDEIWRMNRLDKFKMVTTKKIATKIRNSGLIPKSMDVYISP